MKSRLAHRLKELREEKGIKQIEVSKALDITIYQLSRYENGHTNPSPDLIIEFAAYFGVTTDDLLGARHIDSTTEQNWFTAENVTNEEKQKLKEYLKFLRYKADD